MKIDTYLVKFTIDVSENIREFTAEVYVSGNIARNEIIEKIIRERLVSEYGYPEAFSIKEYIKLEY